MSARDEVVDLVSEFIVEAIQEFAAESVGVREPSHLFRTQAADLLDAIPADVLARYAIERGGMEKFDSCGLCVDHDGCRYVGVGADVLPECVPVYRLRLAAPS